MDGFAIASAIIKMASDPVWGDMFLRVLAGTLDETFAIPTDFSTGGENLDWPLVIKFSTLPYPERCAEALTDFISTIPLVAGESVK
jgi:hypothetical protein